MPLSSNELLASVGASILRVTPEELRSRLESKAPCLLDVRESAEFAQGTIPTARSVPRSALELRIEAVVSDRDAEIVLFCASGARSLLAARALRELGYVNVVSLEGGMNGWRAAGYPVTAASSLTEARRVRYARHLSLAEIGEAGQEKLLASRVLLVGAGGLGSPTALYLAAAGVGTLGIVDGDTVESSNLQRQILHGVSRVGAAKVTSATARLAEQNPDVAVVPFLERLDASNVTRILEGFEIVVDGTDNLATRYVLNDACVRHGIPLVHGSIHRFEGQVTTFVPGGACYRCLHPEPPPLGAAPSCGELGVLGVLPGVIGALQATEVIKWLVGFGSPLAGRLVRYDARRCIFSEFTYGRAADCSTCAGLRDERRIGTLERSEDR